MPNEVNVIPNSVENRKTKTVQKDKINKPKKSENENKKERQVQPKKVINTIENKKDESADNSRPKILEDVVIIRAKPNFKNPQDLIKKMDEKLKIFKKEKQQRLRQIIREGMGIMDRTVKVNSNLIIQIAELHADHLKLQKFNP